MKFNARQYSLASFSVLIALSGTAHSATTYMEARNDAMGGTGVASSHYGTAALANPALLTHFGASDDFSLILPSVGAQVPPFTLVSIERRGGQAYAVILPAGDGGWAQLRMLSPGESLSGWMLTRVNGSQAEFKVNGQVQLLTI